MRSQDEDTTRKADPPGDGGATLDIVRRLIDETSAAAEPAPVAEVAPEPQPLENTAPTPTHQSVALEAGVQQIIAEAEAAPGLADTPTRVVEPDPAERFGWDVIPVDEIDHTDADTAPAWWRTAAAKVWDAVLRFMRRPEAPHEIALALLAIFTIIFPGYVMLFVVLAVLSVLIAWLTLGPDRASEMVANWHSRLAARDPERAERLRRRAARVSAVITSSVDRLPDSWTTGFALPDFEPMDAPPEKLKDDPFDKLAAQVQGSESPQA